MNTNQQKTNKDTLVVLNEKGEVVDVSKSAESHHICQERLRQSRIKFNLATTLIGMSATVCFTGVALFWAGIISEEVVQGATSAPKARSEQGFTQQAPAPNTSLLTMTWMGVVRKDEGVSNVW